MKFEDKLKQEYRHRAAKSAYYKFLDDAVKCSLDAGKWPLIQMIGSQSMPPEGTIRYLPKFSMTESNKSYFERAVFAIDYGFCPMIIDSYRSSFEGSAINVESSNATAPEVDALLVDIDGMGAGLKEIAARMFYQLVVYGRCDVAVEYDERLRPLPKIVFIAPEAIRNYERPKNANEFRFFTWDAEAMIGDDRFMSSAVPGIYFADAQEIGFAAWKDGRSELSIAAVVQNPLGYTPVYGIKIPGGSIAKPLAVLDFNLMNLDSEMRSILRKQAGLSVLVLPSGTDLSRVSSSTVVEETPTNSGITRWASYPAGSLESNFAYYDRQVQSFFELARIKRQKTFAESGESKSLDFTQTEAVLNAAANRIEAAMSWCLETAFAYLGQANAEFKVEIAREWFTEQLSETVDNVLKMQAIRLGTTAESELRKMVRDKALPKMTEADRNASDKEIEELSSQPTGLFDLGAAGAEDEIEEDEDGREPDSNN